MTVQEAISAWNRLAARLALTPPIAADDFKKLAAVWLAVRESDDPAAVVLREEMRRLPLEVQSDIGM